MGSEKEKAAADYLKQQGYNILETNFYTKFGEIDIVAEDEGYLVFAEVKYRTSEGSGLPEEALTKQKIHKICKSAGYYLMRKRLPDSTPVRFDVVAIEKNEIRLHKNAFSYSG
ncbi:MAG: YraN family protein [Lachnospiraceae bacterium]|nr:YraN family protein [Lachnospiraceae bacterium]